MSFKIPYNPDVLKWAREYLNYSEEDIATKFPTKTIEDIKNWENGSASPTYTQLERLAYEIYKKPLAVFFFPEPPKTDNINKSFRTIAEYEFNQIEPKFKLLIDKAYAFQLNIKELINENNLSSNMILDHISFTQDMNTYDMVERLREFLDITLEEQQNWKSVDVALKHWIVKLEDLGIFVFKEAFRNNNYSGFCLYDDKIPIIYLNNSKSKSRQIFTIFHELAHLLFNISGIDSKEHFDYYQGVEEVIERHCNQFAGEFLIPNYDFEIRITNLKINDKNIEKLANLYGVSKEAILRKYLNLRIVSKKYYLEKRDEWNHQYLERKKKQKGGPLPHAKSNAYLSDTYKDIVIDKFIKKQLTREETATYFDIKPNYLDPLIKLYMTNGSQK